MDDPGRSPSPNLNQQALDWSDGEAIDRIVERQLAERFEDEAFHWRLRLVVIETIMLGLLVAVAGFLLGQPIMMVIRAALIVAGSCLATGLLLLSLSAGTAKLLTRMRARIGK